MPPKKDVRMGKRTWQRVRPARPVQVYDLKITLRGSKPPIWRRIGVSSDISLNRLHEVIQVVMGWGNYHLHEFVIRNCQPKPTREELASLDWQARYERLTMCRDRCLSDPQMEVEGAEDERKISLSELASAVKSKFIYEYDFGDGWEHQIEVVKIGPPTERVKYPVCLAGELACPPEDCGGIWGYYEKLEILKNPKHRDYKDIREWMPRGFDPERFDTERINAVLARMRG